MKDVLTLILAGGKGTRLDPLTRDRAKPAVPFGGLYRIIDFTLSNCINSNLRRMLVLTQYKAGSLMQHLARGCQLAPQLGTINLPLFLHYPLWHKKLVLFVALLAQNIAEPLASEFCGISSCQAFPL